MSGPLTLNLLGLLLYYYYIVVVVVVVVVVYCCCYVSRTLFYRTDLKLPYLNIVTSPSDIEHYAVYGEIANLRGRQCTADNILRCTIMFVAVCNSPPCYPSVNRQFDRERCVIIVQPTVMSDVKKFV